MCESSHLLRTVATARAAYLVNVLSEYAALNDHERFERIADGWAVWNRRTTNRRNTVNRKRKRAQKRLAARYAQKLLDELADGLLDAEQDALVRGTARVIVGALREVDRQNKGTNADVR